MQGARHHDRQCRAALYAGARLSASQEPDQLGADLLYRRRRDHDPRRWGWNRQPLRAQKRIFIVCSAGLHDRLGDVRTGAGQSIRWCCFRLLQGCVRARRWVAAVAGRDASTPITLQERAQGDVDLGHGRDDGARSWAPSLGAWLTETYSWHWVFFVNLPFGIITVLGLVIFMDETKKKPRSALRLVRLCCARDRHRQPAGRARPAASSSAGSNPTRSSASSSSPRSASIIFFAHSLTTEEKPFIQFAIFKDKNFIGGLACSWP